MSVAVPVPIASSSASGPFPTGHAGAALNPILHGPLLPTLVRLALPTVAVLFMTTVLSVAETYFVSTLGLAAIAGVSLVVPVQALMTMVSNGGVGGGVSAAIARANGAGRPEDAQSLAWHALVIGVVAGVLFSVVVLLGGPSLYRALGGSGLALQQAVLYSNILFAGAVMFWVLMLMQSALRGAGNVKVPAKIMLISVCAGLLLSPALIVGWLGFPRLGIAGAGVAQLVCNAGALVAIIAYMRSPRSSLRLRRHPLRAAHFRAILGIGLLSSLNAVMTNVSITAVTAAAGVYGVAAIAGYGIASRLDLLLVPMMFGFGTAVLTLVGTNLGAGNVARARHAALVNAALVAALAEAVGLFVAFAPSAWAGLFTGNTEVLQAAGAYLVRLGPTYGLIAVTTSLYFAGQGARHVGWPLIAGAVRLVAAFVGSALVVYGHASLHTAFSVVAAGAVAAGLLSLFGFWRVRWGSGMVK